jgi:endonuclease V-like protein UPF0215 family
VRRDRVVDGLSYGSCTVGGTDATAAIAALVAEMDRADVRYCLVAGVALAWYNVVDLDSLAERVDCPVLSVTFEASDGLEPALREAFEGDALADRLETYRALPERNPVDLDGADGDPDAVFVRSPDLEPETAADVIRAVTPEGGRPEPLRVAGLAARAADQFRRAES